MTTRPWQVFYKDDGTLTGWRSKSFVAEDAALAWATDRLYGGCPMLFVADRTNFGEPHNVRSYRFYRAEDGRLIKMTWPELTAEESEKHLRAVTDRMWSDEPREPQCGGDPTYEVLPRLRAVPS